MNQVNQAARRAAERVADKLLPAKFKEEMSQIVSNIIAAEFAPLQERIIEALTPSAETKAAYIGEFQFDEESDDGRGTATRTVPWTTVKAIMSAIRERAGLAAKENGNG